MKKQRILRILLLCSVLCILSSTAHHNLPADKANAEIRFTETNPPVAPVRPIRRI